MNEEYKIMAAEQKNKFMKNKINLLLFIIYFKYDENFELMDYRILCTEHLD